MANKWTGYTQLAGVIVPQNGWDDIIITGSDVAGIETTADVPDSEKMPGWSELNTTLSSPISSSILNISLQGDQTAKEDIAIVKSGIGGLDNQALRAAWKSSETGTWYGWMDHNILTDIDSSNKINVGSTTSLGSAPPIWPQTFATIACGNGKAMFLVGSSSDVSAYIYDVETSVLSAQVTIAEMDVASNNIAVPTRSSYALPIDGFLLPNGKCQVYSLNLDETSGAINANDMTSMTVTVTEGSAPFTSSSDWRAISQFALSDLIEDIGTYSIYNMKCATDGMGQVVIFIQYCDDTATGLIPLGWMQFASSDGGLNFTLVEHHEPTVGTVTDDTYCYISLDVVWSGTTFVVSSTRYILPTGNIQCDVVSRNIASPFISIKTSDEINVWGGTIPTCGSANMYKCDDGRIFLQLAATYSSGAPSYKDVHLAVSCDEGITWNYYTQSCIPQAFITQLDSCEVNGKCITLATSSYVVASSLSWASILKLGGWNTITHPRNFATNQYELASYGRNMALIPSDITIGWLPFLRPDASTATAFTEVATGTAASYLFPSNAYASLSASTGEHIYYYASMSTCDYNTGIIFAANIKHISGAALEIKAAVTGPLGRYEVGIRLTSSQLYIYDFLSSTNMSTTPYSVASGTEVKLKAAFRKGKFCLYVQEADGYWILVESVTSGFSHSATALTDAVLSFGYIDNAVLASESRWSFIGAINRSGGGVQGAFNDDLADNILAQTPMSLHGGLLPVIGKGTTRLPTGLKLAASGGWAKRGEYFDIYNDAKYPIENILKASPSIKANIALDNTAKNIIFDIGSQDDVTTKFGDTFAFAVFNSDIRYFNIAVKDAPSDAWQDIGYLDLAGDLTSLSYYIQGDVIFPSGSFNTISKHFERDELVGAQVDFGSGQVFRIKGNSDGRWASSGRQMQIRLEGDVSSISNTGTMDIILREGAIVLSELGSLTARYIRVQLPVQYTYRTGEGYIGSMVFGPYIPFATKYSSSRIVSTSPNISISQSEMGITSVKKLGPEMRQVQIAWSEGFDASNQQGDAVGDFITLPQSSDIAIGTRHSSTILEGIQRACDSGRLPIVYIPKLDATSADYTAHPDISARQVIGKNAVILCNMFDQVQRETVMGEEEASEVVRLSGITLREVI